MKFSAQQTENGLRVRFEPQKVWCRLAKHRRKQDCIRIAGKIARERNRFGDNRLFSTHDCLDGDIRLSWVDFYLPSVKDKSIFFNVVMRTCQMEMHETMHEHFLYQVLNEACNEPQDIFDMAAYPPKADGSRQIKIESVPLPMFDGRTRSEEMEHRLAQWYQEQAAKGGDYAVCPRVEVNRAYSYGIGLFATVDYPSLNVQEVNEWIEDFRCRGEIAYTDAPVPQSHLTYAADWCAKLGTSISNAIWM